MKARSKVAMKRENGTYTYDIYIKKPSNTKTIGAVRAVDKQPQQQQQRQQETRAARATDSDTRYKTALTEAGWKTVIDRSSKTGNNERASRQPFVRLGDDLF